MEKHFNWFIINIGLIISGLLTAISGLLIQLEYHIGNHGNIAIDDYVFGISYNGWSGFHKISILMFLLLMIFHISLHWKWYKVVIMKWLIAKNIQGLTLSVVFILVATSGLISWVIDLLKGDVLLRKAFIEIHDKLGIILIIYLILHVVKKLKWFFTTLDKLKKTRRTIYRT